MHLASQLLSPVAWTWWGTSIPFPASSPFHKLLLLFIISEEVLDVSVPRGICHMSLLLAALLSKQLSVSTLIHVRTNVDPIHLKTLADFYRILLPGDLGQRLQFPQQYTIFTELRALSVHACIDNAVMMIQAVKVCD